MVKPGAFGEFMRHNRRLLEAVGDSNGILKVNDADPAHGFASKTSLRYKQPQQPGR